MHRVVRFKRPMHPQHSEELTILSRKGAKPHECARKREIQLPCQLDQLIRCIPLHDTTTRVNHRSFSRNQHVARFFNLSGVSALRRIVGPDRHLFWILKGVEILRVSNIFRNIYNHRTRPS